MSYIYVLLAILIPVEPILINRTATDLKHQLNFLIKREFFVTYYGYKKILVYLICGTFFVLGLSILTDTNSLVTLKGVLIFLTGITWLAGIILLTTILIKRQKRIRWRDSSIKSYVDKNPKGYMTFDNEQITFSTDTYKTEIKWNYYKYYAEDKDSIFFFAEKNLYEAIYFSPSDIGAENLNTLKLIAREKLSLLDQKKGK